MPRPLPYRQQWRYLDDQHSWSYHNDFNALADLLEQLGKPVMVYASSDYGRSWRILGAFLRPPERKFSVTAASRSGG